MLLDRSEYEMDQRDDIAVNKDVVRRDIVNGVYREILSEVEEIVGRCDTILGRIDPLRAGQAINNHGGYRKRKQRTQCKQHKQKHYKTYRKRKTQRK